MSRPSDLTLPSKTYTQLRNVYREVHSANKEDFEHERNKLRIEAELKIKKWEVDRAANEEIWERKMIESADELMVVRERGKHIVLMLGRGKEEHDRLKMEFDSKILETTAWLNDRLKKIQEEEDEFDKLREEGQEQLEVFGRTLANIESITKSALGEQAPSASATTEEHQRPTNYQPSSGEPESCTQVSGPESEMQLEAPSSQDPGDIVPPTCSRQSPQEIYSGHSPGDAGAEGELVGTGQQHTLNQRPPSISPMEMQGTLGCRSEQKSPAPSSTTTQAEPTNTAPQRPSSQTAPTRRVKTFQELCEMRYRGENTRISFCQDPPGPPKFFITRCELHGVSFTDDNWVQARKHLRTEGHRTTLINPADTMLEIFQLRQFILVVVDCTIEKMEWFNNQASIPGAAYQSQLFIGHVPELVVENTAAMRAQPALPEVASYIKPQVADIPSPMSSPRPAEPERPGSRLVLTLDSEDMVYPNIQQVSDAWCARENVWRAVIVLDLQAAVDLPPFAKIPLPECLEAVEVPVRQVVWRQDYQDKDRVYPVMYFGPSVTIPKHTHEPFIYPKEDDHYDWIPAKYFSRHDPGKHTNRSTEAEDFLRWKAMLKNEGLVGTHGPVIPCNEPAKELVLNIPSDNTSLRYESLPSASEESVTSRLSLVPYSDASPTALDASTPGTPFSPMCSQSTIFVASSPLMEFDMSPDTPIPAEEDRAIHENGDILPSMEDAVGAEGDDAPYDENIAGRKRSRDEPGVAKVESPPPFKKVRASWPANERTIDYDLVYRSSHPKHKIFPSSELGPVTGWYIFVCLDHAVHFSCENVTFQMLSHYREKHHAPAGIAHESLSLEYEDFCRAFGVKVLNCTAEEVDRSNAAFDEAVRRGQIDLTPSVFPSLDELLTSIRGIPSFIAGPGGSVWNAINLCDDGSE